METKQGSDYSCHDCGWIGSENDLVHLTEDKYDVEDVCCPSCHSIFVVEKDGFFNQQAD